MIKFKLDKNGTIHINDEYISNGHWLISKSVIRKMKCKPLEEVLLWPNGRYFEMARSGDCADFNTIIGDNVGLELKDTHIAQYDINGEINWFKLKSESYETGINPHYYPILQLGDKWIQKDKNAPIKVMSGDTLLAVVMPMRIT